MSTLVRPVDHPEEARESRAPAPSKPDSRSPSGNSELLSIQYLRAAAALAVLVFHASLRAEFDFFVGNAGVDVFFVISGFIMWVISAQRPLTPMSFLARRVTRIVPLYWVITIVIAAVAVGWPNAMPNIDTSTGHVLKSLLFLPHTDSAGVPYPLLIPGWTLNYEMFFYAIFAASLMFPRASRVWLLSTTLIALVLLGLVLRPTVPVWNVYTNPLMLEFLAGILLGKAWTDGWSLSPVVGLGAIVLGLALLTAAWLSGLTSESLRVITWGIPAFLLVGGAVSLQRVGRVPPLPVLKFLGDASYSIYLVHTLAGSFSARMLREIGLDTPVALFVAAVVVGIAAGSVCYCVLERPLLHLFHRQRRGATHFVLAPGSQALSSSPARLGDN